MGNDLVQVVKWLYLSFNHNLCFRQYPYVFLFELDFKQCNRQANRCGHCLANKSLADAIANCPLLSLPEGLCCLVAIDFCSGVFLLYVQYKKNNPLHFFCSPTHQDKFSLDHIMILSLTASELVDLCCSLSPRTCFVILASMASFLVSRGCFYFLFLSYNCAHPSHTVF